MDKQTNQQQPNGIERRFVSANFEQRSEEGKPERLRGYALRFGSVYDMGWFTEEVHRDAFKGANMEDVRILLNHDASLILGRTKAGTASVGIDDNGLWYEFELPDSPTGQNAREAIRRGDIDQSSWGFRLRQDQVGRNVGDKWEMRDGKEHRVLMDVAEVLDASPVTFPANPDTSIAKRSLVEYKGRESDIASTETSSDIAWMIDNVSWATYRGNEVVMSLNGYADRYKREAESSESNKETFEALYNSCVAAKGAMISMINEHIEALKTLNNSPSRSTEQQEKPDLSGVYEKLNRALELKAKYSQKQH